MDGSLLFSGSVLFTAGRTWFLGLVSVWEGKQLPLGFEMLDEPGDFQTQRFPGESQVQESDLLLSLSCILLFDLEITLSLLCLRANVPLGVVSGPPTGKRAPEPTVAPRNHTSDFSRTTL